MYLLLLLIHVEQYTVMVEAQTFRFSMKKDKSILAVNFCHSNCVLFWIICENNCVKKGLYHPSTSCSHLLAKPKACRYKWVIFHLSLSCI
jgi:hypothetical protein